MSSAEPRAPRAEQDYAELLRQLRTVEPKATEVSDWQKVWLENLVKRERYEERRLT